MAAGWMFFHAELRRRWRAWLALALIVGAFAGVVEAAAAGARRTDAAYPSLLAWSDAPDVLLYSFPGKSATFGRFPVRAAANLPQAERSAIVVSYDVATPAAAEIFAPETDVVPSRYWHRRILSGRLPDPARPGEVNISFTLAQAAHLGTGDTLHVRLATPRLYGVTWNALVSNTQQRGIGEAVGSLARRPSVTAWSAGYSGFPLSIRGSGRTG